MKLLLQFVMVVFISSNVFSQLSDKQYQLPMLNQQLTQGYDIDNYPPDTTIKLHHKDVIGTWFVAPASCTIDTVFWYCNGNNGALESLVYLRIFKSIVGNDWGPGISPYPPPPQSWGYWLNTDDLDRGIAAFREDATDTTWYSTIAQPSPKTRPPFGTELWGFGIGATGVHRLGTNKIEMERLSMPCSLKVGDKFFISFKTNSGPWHIIDDSTEFAASHVNVSNPSRAWVFYEHDSVGSTDSKKGWHAIGGVNTNIWYSMTITGKPQIMVTPDSIDYDSVFVGYSQKDTVKIRNGGDAPLQVFNITCGDTVFKPDITNFTLASFEENNVVVTFSPIDSQSHNNYLNITSDDNNNPSLNIKLIGMGIHPPNIYVMPDSINVALDATDTTSRNILFKNNGLGDLIFKLELASSFSKADKSKSNSNIQGRMIKNLIENKSKEYPPNYYTTLNKNEKDTRIGKHPMNLGGPDHFGYTWIDSDESGGPAFNWQDISSSGTQVYGLTDDNFVGPFPIGFQFSYYGNNYSQFYIGSNGIIGFGTPDYGLGDPSNQPIPYYGIPNNILAWCWDDLIPYDGAVYYKTLFSKLIIQFVNYGKYYSSGRLNAEVIINSDGTVVYQYQNFYSGFDVANCTVGIENNEGNDGLEVVFNNSYLHDNLAILFTPNPMVQLKPTTGLIASGDSLDVVVKLNGKYFDPGTYYSQVIVNSNDPTKPFIDIPVKLVIPGFMVEDGWNLLSIPMQPNDYSVTFLFPTAISFAFSYVGSYQPTDTLKNGLGYWLKFSGREKINIFGSLFSIDTIDVIDRWNMIGSISTTMPTSKITPLAPVSIVSPFFGYYPLGGGYLEVDSIEPGRGYWVKVNNTGKVVLGGQAIMKNEMVKRDSLQNFSQLIIQDNNGSKQTLYFTKLSAGNSLTQDLSYHEMPPAPPEVRFNARFGSNRILEIIKERETQEYPILISAIDYPVTISWKIKSRQIYASLQIGDKNITMGEDGSTQIMAPDMNVKLYLTGLREIPKYFALEQNYPNPFNPATTINYQLPVNCWISLKVYNLLGQVVSTLKDEMQDAGYHTVGWNAGNVASGVYLYRLQAGKFTDIKKMIIMR